jgi:hypothetical protein
MGGSLVDDVLERPNAIFPALRVWVVDDVLKEAEKIASSFQSAGAITEANAQLVEIGDRVRSFENGSPTPDVIVIDQHWKIQNSNLGVFDRSDIKINSRQSVGTALGTFFRSMDSLDDTVLMMTSINEDEVRTFPAELAPGIAVHKSRIKALPEVIKSGYDPVEALADLGIDRGAISQSRRTGKWLTYAATALGMGENDAARLAGAKRGAINSTDALRQFLWMSRDAHARSREIQTILVLLRKAYGDALPPLAQIESDFGLALESVLLDAGFDSLVRLRVAFEAKAGGPLG